LKVYTSKSFCICSIMGDKKRSRLEKKAKKILKKLRRAEEPVEKTPETSNPPKKVYGPPRPPKEVLESRPIIGPEIPEAYKKVTFCQIKISEPYFIHRRTTTSKKSRLSDLPCWTMILLSKWQTEMKQ